MIIQLFKIYIYSSKSPKTLKRRKLKIYVGGWIRPPTATTNINVWIKTETLIKIRLGEPPHQSWWAQNEAIYGSVPEILVTFAGSRFALSSTSVRTCIGLEGCRDIQSRLLHAIWCRHFGWTLCSFFRMHRRDIIYIHHAIFSYINKSVRGAGNPRDRPAAAWGFCGETVQKKCWPLFGKTPEWGIGWNHGTRHHSPAISENTSFEHQSLITLPMLYDWGPHAATKSTGETWVPGPRKCQEYVNKIGRD